MSLKDRCATEIVDQRPMPMPLSRGPLSSTLLDILRGDAAPDALSTSLLNTSLSEAGPIMTDEDRQLALFLLYEMHYGGIENVDDDLEWNPELLRARAELELQLENELRRELSWPRAEELQPITAASIASRLFEMTAPTPGDSLARYIAREANHCQAEEFLIHRSLYTLKEADPHSWAIPRLSGRAKAALVEIQADEYGGGRPERMHATLFAQTLAAAGLDPRYGRYIDRIPAITISSLNVMTFLGLHRRLRGAIVGHLAAFEMTSAIPNRHYANGFRRLGYSARVTAYFDEHVEADAVHEQIAGRDLAGGFAEADPAMASDVLFGFAACLFLDDLVAAHLLDHWRAGRSSLRDVAS